MSRPLRLEFPGAVYHITARGNARNNIFLKDADRELFLAGLGEVVERFGWLCHAYCLMDNHYHLLVETLEGNLSLGMRQLNGVYTQRFNRYHGRVGHIFQGRFKAIVVDRDSYLLELCRYVVLNPLRAGMVKSLARYRWSSYPATVGMIERQGWLSIDWVLGQFGKYRAVAQRRYADFVAQGRNHPSPWSAVKGQAMLGSEAFVEKMRPLLKDSHELKEISRAQRLLHRPGLEQLLTKSVQGAKILRDAAIRKAHLEYGYSMAAIARHVGIHYSTVSKVIKGER